MSFTDKKREEIKKYILRKIALDDADLIFKTMDSFEISITSVKRYLQEGLKSQIIERAEERVCGYRLVERIFCEEIDLKKSNLAEDRLFAEYIVKHLDGCNEQALKIWQYTCAEMLNNAIEHSRGNRLTIEVHTNFLYTRVILTDDGVGAFQTLLEYMKEHGWESPRVEDAMVELYKGRITSNESRHSGEGIFFSSKMVDQFMIWSDARLYKGGSNRNTEAIRSHLLAYASRLNKIGTMVFMSLENETERKIGEVFNMYADIDEGLIKTSIPIKEACINGEPVARSQARRICNRLDIFKEVILDFNEVEFIGQGFADEIFRVYATAHPQVFLKPIHMLPDVERMIRHVGRGNLPENVCLTK